MTQHQTNSLMDNVTLARNSIVISLLNVWTDG